MSDLRIGIGSHETAASGPAAAAAATVSIIFVSDNLLLSHRNTRKCTPAVTPEQIHFQHLLPVSLLCIVFSPDASHLRLFFAVPRSI